MFTARLAVLCTALLVTYGCSDQTSKSGNAESARNSSALPNITIPEKDSCTKKAVQIGLLKTAREEFATLLRGVLGVQYWVPKQRADANLTAIKIMNLPESPWSHPAKGYDLFDYFALESLVTEQYNEATGVFKCGFTVRVFGTVKRPRSIEVIVGDDDLTATKEQFQLPKDDVLLRGYAIISKADIDRYEEKGEEMYLREDGSLADAFRDLLGRLRWSAVTLGNIGTVEIGDDISEPVGRAENAARWLYDASISPRWAALYRVGGT